MSNAAWATALALAAMVGARVWRRNPAVAHALWLLVLLKLMMPSLVELASPWAGAPTQARAEHVESNVSQGPSVDLQTPAASLKVSTSSAKSTSGRPLHPRDEFGAKSPSVALAASTSRTWPWRPAVVFLWLIGAVAWWGIVGRSSSRFLRLMRSARPAPAELEERVSQVASRLGLRRIPTIGIVPARIPPMLWAPFAGPPRLLLPEELWARFDVSQQDAVLAHELAHLKRRDHWVRRLEVVVLRLYWWDPVAWWARRQLERTEEECCDAWVIWALPAAAPAYAEALVATTAFLSGLRQRLPMGASGAGRTLPLKRRLNMILCDLRTGSAARTAPRTVLIVGVLSLPFLPAVASARPAQGSAPAPLAQAQVRDQASQPATPPIRGPASKTTKPPDRVQVDRPVGRVVVQVSQPVVREVGDYVDVDCSPFQPGNRVDLQARVGGVLQKVNCRPGQRVKKGEVLFEIDPAAYKIELEKAEAEVRRFESRLKRWTAQRTRVNELSKQHVIGQEEVQRVEGEYEEAEASLQGAKATRDLAKLNLDFTKVTAPIDGAIRGPVLHEGNFVKAESTELTKIISQEVLYMDVYIDESSVLRLNRLRREGKIKSEIPILASVREEDGFPHRGSIDYGDLEVQETGLTRVRSVFPNPDGSLSPGLRARVRIVVGSPYKGLLVPERVVTDQNDRRYVFVLNDQNIVDQRFVRVGPLYDDLRCVESGLKAGEWIIDGAGPDWLGMRVPPENVLRTGPSTPAQAKPSTP